MTPNQMTRKMAREIRQTYRVHNHIKDTCQSRAYGPLEGEGQRALNIRVNYGLLYFYNGLVVDKFNQLWRSLEQWADRHTGVPQRFADPLGSGKIRLLRMMATNNELTDAQVDGYTVVDEEFTAAGQGLTRYERFFELLDAMQDLAVVFTRRLNWWQDEWALQGSTPRENQVIAILGEATDALGVLRSELANMTILTRDQKGDAGGVNELRVRARFTKPRRTLAGGLQAINRGVTTTAGVTGGQPLAAGPEPDEFDPDVDTVRDEPELGTDPEVV